MDYGRTDGGHRPSLVRWSGVWAGTITSIAVMALLTSLWVAIGYGSGQGWVSGYINWWIGGSAIASLFVGGFLAAWVTRPPGAAQGLVDALIVWGLVLIAGALFALPGTNIVDTSQSILWTTFWSLLVGLGAAVVGGGMGGAMSRPGGEERISTTGEATTERTVRTREYVGR
jgi:hypothetical protein